MNKVIIGGIKSANVIMKNAVGKMTPYSEWKISAKANFSMALWF